MINLNLNITNNNSKFKIGRQYKKKFTVIIFFMQSHLNILKNLKNLQKKIKLSYL